MPLAADYRAAMDSDIADIKNISGSRYEGAIHAALFLQEYVGENQWVHLDIADLLAGRKRSPTSPRQVRDSQCEHSSRRRRISAARSPTPTLFLGELWQGRDGDRGNFVQPGRRDLC